MSKVTKELSQVKVSGLFEIAGFEFIKFSDSDGETIAVAKDCLFRSEFGKDNNLKKSTVLKRLEKEVLPALAESERKRLCPECIAGRLEDRIRKTRNSYKKPEAIRKKADRLRRRPLQEEAKKEHIAWDMRRCKNCLYGAILDGNYQICDYITIMGHSRPCLPGADCTEFKAKEKGVKRKKASLMLTKGKPGGGYGAYVQDSMFRTERKRYGRYK